ncbi:MAG: hypothetical protein H7837_04725 [Magnetococcus sp. MYC-9]
MLSFLFGKGDKRTEQRKIIQRNIQFVTGSGVTCTGATKNISKDALLLVSESRSPVGVNEEGELIVDYKGVTSVFPGQVVRVDKYCLDKYCIAVKFGSQEARDFFEPMIVTGVKCYNCGNADNLEKCPQCRGIQTICAACSLKDTVCRACRADEYLFSVKNG